MLLPILSGIERSWHLTGRVLGYTSFCVEVLNAEVEYRKSTNAVPVSTSTQKGVMY